MYKYLLSATLILVMLAQQTCIVDSIVYKNIYVVNGIYTGMFELVASGTFMKLVTTNTTSSGSGILRVTYQFEAWIHVVESTSYKFVYAYRLISYRTWSRGFSRDFVKLVNETLDSYLGKTFTYVDNSVDLYLLLSYNLSTKTFYFENFQTYHNISAVTLYEDTVCFEYKRYNEVILNNRVYRDIETFYYDVLSGTPLYLYDYHSVIDLMNDLNHFYVKRVVFEDGVGHGLSRISSSRTKVVNYDHSTGKISFVSYFTPPSIKVKPVNNTLYVDVESKHPYIVVIMLENSEEINYSSIPLKTYRLRTKTLYLSSIRYTNSTLTFTFSDPVIRVVDQQGNATYIHEVTVSEKNYSSTYVIVYTIVLNVLAISIAYSISKFIAKILEYVI